MPVPVPVAGALFADDGTFDAAPGMVFSGPQGIEHHIASEVHQRNLEHGSAHVLSPVVIEIEGDSATGVAYSQVLYRDAPADGYRVGRVTATRWHWARTPDGWRTTDRVSRPLDGGDAARRILAGSD